jgi:YD repeat-containing protein
MSQPMVFPPRTHTRRRGHPRAAPPVLLCLALALVAWGDAAASVEHAVLANLARGAAGVLSPGPFDQVDLFNGNLLYGIDLGQSYPVSATFSYRFGLHYNSLIWDFEVGEEGTAAYPVRDADAGVGWDLSLGRLHGPEEGANPTGRWVYVAPDGGQHRLYGTLHPGDPQVPGALFSRDGTYLQLLDEGSDEMLRFPDGRHLIFEPEGAGWRLARMEDRQGAGVSIAYSADGNQWTLTDDTGRQQIATFVADSTGTYPHLLSTLDLAAFGGTRALYSFAYTTATVSRPSADDAPSTPASVTVPLLTQVLLPDGTGYALSYHLAGFGSGNLQPEDSGRLLSVTLPTLGRTEWSYAVRQFPWLDCTTAANRYLADGVSVRLRTLIDRTGAVVGTWNFGTALDPPRPKASTCDQPRQLTVTVITPLGHVQRQYFSVYVSGSSAVSGGEPWSVEDYGLPFTKNYQDSSGLLLSSEVLENQTLLRSLRVAYEQDAASTCTPDCAEHNPRVQASRSIFHDDGARYVERVRSGFDGFGHFATVVSQSSFAGEQPSTQSTVYLDDTAQWLLGQAVETHLGRGSEVRVTKRCLDAQGRVVAERRLAGAVEGAHDLLTRTLRNPSGFAEALEYYGGDLQSLPTSSDPCNLVTLGAPQYRQEMQYDGAAVRSTSWVGADGETVAVTVDRDIDPATGLVAASRDAAGLETTQSYDAMGRLTEVVRPQGYRSQTVYSAASASEPARVTTTHRSENGATVLAMDRVEIDGFGRQVAREHKDSTGAWIGERTVFDALGERTAVTDALGRTTQYLDYDPFGRPRLTAPPGGAAAQVVATYAGIRTLSTSRQVGSYLRESDDALIETTQSTLQVFDSDGRLVRTEGPDGSIARRSYDLDGHLIRSTTETAVDPETTLSESVYDGRGLLIEATDADGATVAYSGYDAAGHLTRQQNEYGVLVNEFDRAGRLVQVAVEGGPTLKEFVYATDSEPGEWGAGKLRQAIRYNYGIPGLSGPLRVIDDYTYGGRGGRLSERTTTLRDAAAVREVFTATASYDDLGQLATFGYPQCDRNWYLVCVPAQRTISYTYRPEDRRLLKKVTSQHNADPPVDFATNLTYFGDGTTSEIWFSYSPVMYETFTAHPDLAGRYSEAAICSLGTCTHFRPMVYDSAGQLARYVVGPVPSDEVRLLPTGPPDPSTSRSSLTELRATLAAAAGAPSCPTFQRDATGVVVRSDECPGGGLAPRVHFYAYDASDHLLWRVASFDGTSLAGWGHLWHLFDFAGRKVREYDQVTSGWNWIRDWIYRGGSLLGWVETVNSLEGADQRYFVHVDPFGAPFSKHRVENGVIRDWSLW